MKVKKAVDLMLVFFLLGFIGIFLFSHFQLSQVRFFDLDEYAHLHWSFNAYRGFLPYKDFFYPFSPFYLYIVALLNFITGKTFAYALWARGLSFIFYCLAAFFLFLISRKTKNLLFALFTIFVFTYLPLPTDKWLEVRPDGLGTMFALGGVWLFLLFFSRRKFLGISFLSFFLLSLGFVINPKTIFYIISTFLVLIFNSLFFSKKRDKKKRENIKVDAGQFLLGLAIPVVFLFVLFSFFADFSRAFYLVFVFHKEVGAFLTRRFPMSSNIFFYPNHVFYGWLSVNFNYFANFFIYFLAAITAIIRLVSFLTEETEEKMLTNLFLALLFFTNLVAYIKFFPLKHAQYLIGVSPFVAYFFADFIFGVWKWSKKRNLAWRGGYLATLWILVVFMVFQGVKMDKFKASRTNADGKMFLAEAQRIFAEDEYVWDLTGASLFYKDPYYICCLPYGDYFDVLKIKLPNLEEALRRREVKHIFVQFPERSRVLPEYHAKILNQYYTNSNPGYFIILYAGVDIEFDKNEKDKEFELIASGWYKIYLDGNIVSVKKLANKLLLDRKVILANPIYMEKGKYTLTNLGKRRKVKFVYERE